MTVSASNIGMDRIDPSSEEDVLKFARMFHVQYPIAFDGSLDVAHKYLQGAFPTIVIIDRKKTVTYLNKGETSFAELSFALTAVST